MENTTNYKVGDIVKFTVGNEGVAGILYENGNKNFGNFRVETADGTKYRHLKEGELQPATPEELSVYNENLLQATIQNIKSFNPQIIVQRETDEAGGEIPEPLEPPYNDDDEWEDE
jgi:hypothetical protein